jgi:hypothetical protein
MLFVRNRGCISLQSVYAQADKLNAAHRISGHWDVKMTSLVGSCPKPANIGWSHNLYEVVL